MFFWVNSYFLSFIKKIKKASLSFSLKIKSILFFDLLPQTLRQHRAHRPVPTLPIWSSNKAFGTKCIYILFGYWGIYFNETFCAWSLALNMSMKSSIPIPQLFTTLNPNLFWQTPPSVAECTQADTICYYSIAVMNSPPLTFSTNFQMSSL